MKLTQQLAMRPLSLSMSPLLSSDKELLMFVSCSYSVYIHLRVVYLHFTSLCVLFPFVDHRKLPNSLFVGQLSQLHPLLDSINRVRTCVTPYCRGMNSVIMFIFHICTCLFFKFYKILFNSFAHISKQLMLFF